MIICGAHYPNFIIHHFVTIQNHKHLNHMLELCKEASIDCILDDSDNSDTYLVVRFRIFNSDLFLDLSSFDMLTYQHSFKRL